MYYLIPILVVVVPILGFAILSATAKRPENLGVIEGRLQPCPASPNCVSSQADDAPHFIEPIAFVGSPEDALERLKIVLRQLPRVQLITEKADYIHAEATSLLFRYVDDVEFYVDRQAGVIHCRSASRVGRSDLGVNRARIEKIRAALKS